MNRIPDIDDSRCAHWLQNDLDECAAGDDNDLIPSWRRDREEVIAGSNLKRGDDVLLLDCIPFRVIGPARQWDCVSSYYPPWFGDSVATFEILPTDGYLTDRAPLDPNEAPMPVFPLEALDKSAAPKTVVVLNKQAALEKIVASMPLEQGLMLKSGLKNSGHWLEVPVPVVHKNWFKRLFSWLFSFFH